MKRQSRGAQRPPRHPCTHRTNAPPLVSSTAVRVAIGAAERVVRERLCVARSGCSGRRCDAAEDEVKVRDRRAAGLALKRNIWRCVSIFWCV